MSDERDQVSGSVERITFYNEENGYTVLKLKPDSRGMLPFKYASGRDALITVIGNMPELNLGEWLKLTGKWVNHARHGRQFQAETFEQAQPASIEGIQRYLGSGLIRGIGPVMAERIVDKFGDQALDVIELEPGRLREVPGIGPKRIEQVLKAWDEQRAIRAVMLFLQSHNVSSNLAVKIYKQYGDDSLAVVQNTPYQLIRDVYGIGFVTADRIAQALGMATDDPGRIEAGIAYTLSRMAGEGHVYVPQEELEPEVSEILAIDVEKVNRVIERLEGEEQIRRETLTIEATDPDSGDESRRVERAVYLTPFYFAEVGVARRMRQIIRNPVSRLAGLGRTGIQDSLLSPKMGGEDRPSIPVFGETIELTPMQKEAVSKILTEKVTILTGGPGTGKTTTLRALLDILDHNRLTYALASPTGRAAKRLAEATGRSAKTIHRLLEFNPGEGFGRDDSNPLDVDVVVIDEASMLDLVLTNHLLKAIDLASHLVLVGDVDQLPSVGAGDVLRDLIKSGIAAVIRLEIIFRQAAGSLIIRNAHRINEGLLPETPKDASDFFLFVKEDPIEAAELLVDIVKNRVPHRFGLDPFDDIQIISPMYKGAAGVSNLNDILQQSLNPSGRKAERRLGGQVFRVGDKVMQTVNNYDKNVYNGDIGRITQLDVVQQTLTVNIDGAPVYYDFLEVDELVHAYAISVHKSQGSEYPCVVMPALTQHYLLLQRNLLYTAITRARKLVIIVGTRKAIAIAVKNNKVANRYTALEWRLQR
jgi:exodeoxyribonuclease V alpha subunit